MSMSLVVALPPLGVLLPSSERESSDRESSDRESSDRGGHPDTPRPPQLVPALQATN